MVFGKKSKKKASFREAIHYYIDNYLAKGSSALFLSLLVTFLSAFILIGLLRLGLLYLIPHEADPNDPSGLTFSGQVWRAFLQLTAPGNMNQDNKSDVGFKITAILAGFTGVVIFSTLIATLTTALNNAIANLKQGHSRVLEEDHTLIVGWNQRVTEILRELVEANEAEENAVVVIMADKDKPWMDEYLRSNFRDRGTLRIVTRTGNPASPESLTHVSVADCKSVIVLANCDDNATHAQQVASDARGIKVVLALETTAPDADFPIVCELFLARNREVVLGVVPGRVKVIDSEEILAKVMVQTSRTSGLSVVYAELLSFEGCELYFYEAQWNGITFAQSQFHFPDGVPIGIRDSEGIVQIRPSLDTILEDGCEILIVAQDDSTIDFVKDPVATSRDLSIPDLRIELGQEKMLMLGWSSKAPIIISEYAEYVNEGSKVVIALHEPTPKKRAEIEALNEEIDDLEITLVTTNPFDGKELALLEPFNYDDIIILPQNIGTDGNAERIDSETIVVLLLLRHMKNSLIADGAKIKTKVVTEVLDSNNQTLIHQAGVNDFIISNRLVSMLLAQISEEPDIQLVYDDLFQEDGSEIYVKPIDLYFDSLPQTVSFADLMGVAQKRDEEVCIGIKIGKKSTEADENYGITLIPEKNTVYTIEKGDALVVVAEDER
ncbi:MAG: hypothetical protein AAFN77_13280 [Planctomycetota bacterium]